MNRKEFLQNTFKGAAVGLILPHFPELLEAEAGQDEPPVQLVRAERQPAILRGYYARRGGTFASEDGKSVSPG